MAKRRWIIACLVFTGISIALLVFFYLKTPDVSWSGHDESAVTVRSLYILATLAGFVLFIWKRKWHFAVLCIISLVFAVLLSFPASYLASCDRHNEMESVNYWRYLSTTLFD